MARTPEPQTRRAPDVIEGPASQERSPIRKLPPELVSRIAAGEVVENPASVVKELVENAIDAGANTVEVTLEGGGLERIEVSDDGSGIPETELRLAVERHATSKLGGEHEFGAIRTLGFRGEALASIASVSRLRLSSRDSSSEVSHGLIVEGGSIKGEFLEGRATGTTVEVRNLFYNTPARRKFLRSPPAEQVEVVRTMEVLYLARPEVGLALRAGEAEIVRLAPERSLRNAAGRVLGWEVLTSPVELDVRLPSGGTLRALIGHPSRSSGTSQSLYFSVNGRAVVSRAFVQTLRVAYTGFLPKNRYPVGIVQLEIDPARVDVNVHPTKREVRLAHEREILDEIRRAVRESLLRVSSIGEPPMRSGAEVYRPRSSQESAPLAFAPSLIGLDSLSVERHPITQRRLIAPASPAEVPATSRHPAIRLRTCLFQLYWVGETAEGIALIDQHAASERLLYEEILKEGRLARQDLVSPVLLQLTPVQSATLATHQETVRAAAFEVESIGGESFWLRSVPAYRARRTRPEALADLLDELTTGGRPTVPNGLRERTAATIACHAAIRAGEDVPEQEFGRVLEALFALPEIAYACPHGRPIMVQLPRSRLDRWFLRSGD